MAIRYLITVVEDKDSGPQEPTLPEGFAKLEQSPHVTLYCNSPGALQVNMSGGYQLLGMAFPRRDRDTGQSATAVAKRGPETARAHLSRLWGAFVSFKIGSGGEVSLVRDPSGQLPCFVRAGRSCWYIASDLDLLRRDDDPPWTIDWDEVSQELLFINHFSRRTALAGITELLPGEEFQIDCDGGHTVTAWTPWDHTAPAVTSINVATTRLGRAFDEVFEALASHDANPIITVSGGLDSSIVALGMAKFTDRARLLTFFTDDDPLGDERAYAQVVARATGLALTELPYCAPDFSTCCRTEMPLPRPTVRSLAGLVDTMLLDQAFLGGNSAALGGYGGDNIFAITAAAYALRDGLKSGQSPGALLQIARDIKRLTASSYLDIGRHAVRAFMSSHRYSWPGDGRFLSKGSLSKSKPAILHPWMEGAASALPGSASHVAAIIRSHYFLQWFPRTGSVENLSPLLMAPIVEICLSIPSWLWCAGGHDRSVARRATDRLPDAIANRRSKGSPVALHTKFFETYRQDLCQFLCEGMLVQQGIADKEAIYAYCSQPPPVRDLGFLRVLEMADAEIWCRQHSR